MANRNANLSPEMEARKWKKGQSGNPKGRPPRRTLESYVYELLDQKIGPKNDQTPRMRALAAVIVDEMLNRRNDKVMRPMLDRLWPAESRHRFSGDPENPIRTESTVRAPLTDEEREALQRIAHRRLQQDQV